MQLQIVAKPSMLCCKYKRAFGGLAAVILPLAELLWSLLCVLTGLIILVTSLVYVKLVCFHGISLRHKFSLFALLCLPGLGLIALQPHLSLDG